MADDPAHFSTEYMEAMAREEGERFEAMVRNDRHSRRVVVAVDRPPAPSPRDEDE